MKTSKLKISYFELVWYILCGLCVLGGLVDVLFGLLSQFLPLTKENNIFAQLEEGYKAAFGLGFLSWGLILIAIGIIAAVIVLCACSTKYDRESEKATRRAARLNRFKKDTEAPVIDAEVSEVK